MKKNNYESFKEWRQDLDRFCDNPNDMDLLKKIVKRQKNSSQELQDEINIELENFLIGEPNPIYAFLVIARRHPDKLLMLNNKDLFFKC